MGIAGIAAMASDRKLKKNIRDADGDVEDFMKGLKAYKYDYKDEKFGEGKRLGIMAQDLEKTKLGKRAVIDTDEGKMVDVRTLAGALAASTANLNKRLAKVEAGAR
jgi:hypothetical protein